MRYPPEHKEETRQKILAAAARAFRRDGFSATGVDSVMAEAGLTAGAFYGHFASKDELFAICMKSSFENQRQMRERGLDGMQGQDRFEGLIANYLSLEHLEQVENGCPLPSLAPEMGRASDAVRSGFERQLFVWADELALALKVEYGATLSANDRRSLALGAISAMVGGMTLARAMPSGERAARLLSSTKEMALEALREGVRAKRRTPAPDPSPDDHEPS